MAVRKQRGAASSVVATLTHCFSGRKTMNIYCDRAAETGSGFVVFDEESNEGTLVKVSLLLDLD